jgi:putative endonuclease
MAESHELGGKGEELAEAWLRDRGYRIRHRNWKAGKLEIDIVAENDECVVFAEVKTRTKGFMSDPREAVTREKQRSIIFAADTYIRKFNINKDSRFDVIVVISDSKEHTIEHIENAFYPTIR